MEKGKPKKKEKGRDSRDSDKEKNGSKVKESEKEKERNGSRGRELDRERNGSRGKELEERERNGKPKEPVEKERNGAREKEPEKEKNGKGREPEKEKRIKEAEREKSGRAKEPEKEKNGVKSKESEERRKEGEKEKVKEKERGRDRAKEERHREEKRKDLEKEKHKEKEEREKENSPALINAMMELPDKNKQILVLGLDGAGKTSLLHSLALNRVQHSMAPTQGFNAVCINTEDSQMEFLEIGGSEAFRPYWQKYLSKGLLLVFVVDSADHNRLPEAREQLHQLTRANPLLPLVVFANKQDLDTAYHITDIHDALALSEVGNNRKMFLFGTQVTENGSEIPPAMQDARDLIAQLAADMQ